MAKFLVTNNILGHVCHLCEDRFFSLLGHFWSSSNIVIYELRRPEAPSGAQEHLVLVISKFWRQNERGQPDRLVGTVSPGRN